MSSTGSFAIPMFISSRLRVSPTLVVKDQIYRCPGNGCINEEIFMAWLEHFRKFVKRTRDGPISFLIIDIHGFHKTLNAFIFCRDKWIVLTIPPPNLKRWGPMMSLGN
jgi:hypothetical protein